MPLFLCPLAALVRDSQTSQRALSVNGFEMSLNFVQNSVARCFGDRQDSCGKRDRA